MYASQLLDFHSGHYNYTFLPMNFLLSVLFDDALIALRRRRNIPPALYNARRLAELPIPDTGDDEIDDQQVENEELLEDETEIEHEGEHEDQSESETENQHEDFDLQFDGDSEDDPIMQDAAQNDLRTLPSVQNNSQANVDDSLFAAHIDTGAHQSIDSNARKENLDTQDGVDSRDVGLHTSGRSVDLVVSNPQKDAMANGNNQNGKDDCAPIANKSSVANQHETTVAERPGNSATFDTNHNTENTIEEIFIPANAESNDEPDEAQIDLPNDELNAIQPNDPIKTEELPLHLPVHANNVELNEILDEEDMVTEEIDDDLTIIVDSKIGFAKPLNSNVDGLIKRQNDVVSGNIPFVETVSNIKLNKISSF